MKQLIIILFFILFAQFNTVFATFLPHTYWTGTYCIEPYVHADIDILSLHVEIQLSAIREIEYKITYQLQVTDGLVNMPFVYLETPRRGSASTPATRNMKITLDNGMAEQFSLDQETIPADKWGHLNACYKGFPVIINSPYEGILDGYLSYLPLPLKEGGHTLVVQYKAKPDVDREFMWYHYFIYISLLSYSKCFCGIRTACHRYLSGRSKGELDITE